MSMDALERCARMVRDAEDASGCMPDAHYVDQAEWGAIGACILKNYRTCHGVSPDKQTMATFEVLGVPVRKFEILGAGDGPRGQEGGWWHSAYTVRVG
jgi:hypothetical protein